MAQFTRGLLLGLLLGLFLLGLTWFITRVEPIVFALAATRDPATATAPPVPVAVAAPVEPTVTVTLEPTAVSVLAVPTDTPVPRTPSPVPSPISDCLSGKGVMLRGSFPAATIGRKLAYRVYLPPCYHAGDPAFPVLYMLHGSIQDDSQWDLDGLDEAALAAIQARAAVPFVIALPAADLDGTYMYSAGGSYSWEQVMLADFLPFVELNYNVRTDREGRAIGGLSRGAVWALEIAFRHPDLFLSVGSHSGAQSVAKAPAAYHPLVLAREAPGVETLRIYIDAGQNDWYIEGQKQLHAILLERGIEHSYVISAGTHDDAYWKAHVQDYVAFYAAGWK